LSNPEIAMLSKHRSGVRNADQALDEADQALDELGQLLLREQFMEVALQEVVDSAKQVLPGDLETSVSVLFQDFPTTVVYTDQLAVDCDERQYAHGDGPCLHAATSGQLTEIADAQAETRWRDYVQEAAERGALSSLSVPLPISEKGVSAALNIYARRPNAFDEETRSVAMRFAPLAATAVTRMQAFKDAQKVAEAWPIRAFRPDPGS
jgi:GAF domain-containing protein